MVPEKKFKIIYFIFFPNFFSSLAGPQKLKCFKKNLRKKKYCWKFFQVRRTHSQAVGSGGLVAGPPNLKCFFKKLVKENRKEKKIIISFLFS
jgi:hypothetical protein